MPKGTRKIVPLADKCESKHALRIDTTTDEAERSLAFRGKLFNKHHSRQTMPKGTRKIVPLSDKCESKHALRIDTTTDAGGAVACIPWKAVQ